MSIMRKNIVAGNWKMNLEYEAGISLFSDIVRLAAEEVKGNQEIVVCPPYIHVHGLSQLLKNDSRVFVGAQNCHQEPSGAFTGEVSAAMLQSAGASHVIIGHSERRAYFAEDDSLLLQKLNIALKNNLTPIFCVGETLEQRNLGTHFDIIESQLKNVAFQLEEALFSKIILAYEPVWAIGTGLTASPGQAQEIHAYIREKTQAHYNHELARNLSILYGGSCNPENAPQLFGQEDIDGGLIGGASLKARDFIDIIKIFNA